MEHEQLWALHLGKCKDCAVTLTHNRNIRRLSRQKWFQRHRPYATKMSVNGESMILGLPSCKIRKLCDKIDSELNYRPPN